jgi:hypothetical protein
MAIANAKTIFATDPINGILYANGKWVAVGGGASKTIIAHSSNGLEWTKATSKTPNVFLTSGASSRVIYDGLEGSKQFIAVGRKGNIFYSANGEEWEKATVDYNGLAAKDIILHGVAYGNNMFIAVGTTTESGKPYLVVAKSDNGTSWQVIDKPNALQPSLAQSLRGSNIASDGTNFIVAFGIGTSNNGAMIGKTTNGADMALAANVAKAGSEIAAGGYDPSYNPSSVPSFTDVIHTGTQWIMGGIGGTVAFSQNGTSWGTPIEIGQNIFSTNMEVHVAYGNGKVVAVNSNNDIAGVFGVTSSPVSASSTWKYGELNTNGSMKSPRAIAYGDTDGDNVFIVSGSSGQMIVAHEGTLD